MADDAVASWLEENGHSGSFFFFKQKTAYEIIAGDWSSDVCSSDLFDEAGITTCFMDPHQGGFIEGPKNLVLALVEEIGRASCRERV